MPPPLAPESAFVEVQGIRVHCVRAGHGPAIVLVHGLAGSTKNWRKTIPALAEHAAVYALDQANMGKSQRLRGLDPGLQASADRIAAAMDALGLAQADVAGHSHGGAVVLMLAARHPRRIRRMVLFAPANPYSQAGQRLLRMYNSPPGRLLARAAPYLPRRAQLWALRRMYGDPARATPECLDGYIEGLRIPGTMQHVLGIVGRWDQDMALLEAALPQIGDVPTLLVWGDRDGAVAPASAVALQRILPRSELRIVPGAGHIPFEESPDETNALLREWLARTLTQPLAHPAPAGAMASRKPDALSS